MFLAGYEIELDQETISKEPHKSAQRRRASRHASIIGHDAGVTTTAAGIAHRSADAPAHRRPRAAG